jgi:branched-chain amino acid transport system substrate-binding protein
VKPKALIAALVIAVALIAGVLLVRRGNDPEVTRIGVVLPFTGSMAEYGGNAREGLTLANEEITAANGGRERFQLLYQDTKDAPQETVNAVRRLIDVDSVHFIIGGLTSSGVLAAAPYAQSHGVLFFSPAASAPGIPEIGNLVFRNWPGDDLTATQFGDAAYNRLGLRRVAILHVSNDYGNTNAHAFTAAFRKAGGEIPLTRAFAQGATDYRTLITEIAALQPLDKVFLIAYPDEFRGLFQAISTSSLPPGKVLASDAFYSPELLVQLGAAAEGTIVAVAAKPGADYQPRQRFINAYGARFRAADGTPKEPGLAADNAYDALHLFAAAIDSTNGTPQAVSAWLLQRRNYPGAVGPTTFTPTGDVGGELALYEVRNAQFVPVQR